MKTQAEFVADAVSARSKMFDELEKLRQTAVETLVPLIKQDFEHQRFVRGISRDKSLELVEESLDIFVARIKSVATAKAFMELAAEGKLHDGL